MSGAQPISPPAIHTLWVGARLGPSEWLCLTSWTRQGHPVGLHVYEEMAAPKGVALIDANRLCPRAEIFRAPRTGSVAAFADLFRARLLASLPVVWMDADVYLLRPFLFLEPNVLSQEGSADDHHYNNAVMRLQPGHPILEEIFRRYERPWLALPWRQPRRLWPIFLRSLRSRRFTAAHLPWGSLGRLAIERQIGARPFDGRIIDWRLSLTARRAPLFEPFDGADEALADPVLYVHLYRSQVDAELARPRSGSIYARLWGLAGLDPARDWPPRER